MPRKNQAGKAQIGLLEARVSTAPCVPGIRDKVRVWRDCGYIGVTDTTRLTSKPWDYVKVLQTDYNNLQATQFADLLVLGGRQLW